MHGVVAPPWCADTCRCTVRWMHKAKSPKSVVSGRGVSGVIRPVVLYSGSLDHHFDSNEHSDSMG